MNRSISRLGGWFVALGVGFASVTSIVPVHAQEMCGGRTYPFPYTDVSAVAAAFCPGIMEAYVTGISKGTTPTTFSPNEDVPRLQMTTFLQRTFDQVLARSSRRAALDQWWTPAGDPFYLQMIPLGVTPWLCKSDGERIWVAAGSSLKPVWASTGEVQAGEGLFGSAAESVLVVAGTIISADRSGQIGFTTPQLANPGYSGGTFQLALPYHPYGIAYDGAYLWTANYTDGSITLVSLPAGVICCAAFPGITVGGFSSPIGFAYDGANMWLTDGAANKLYKLNSDGSIAQTVAVGSGPAFPAFDGANIWVPNENDNSITVVRAATGAVVATIPQDASNNLSNPIQAAFDGERILVTNYNSDSVTLYRAADLSFIANVATGSGSHPFGVCSDGINFWVTLNGTAQLARY
jgi:YVTN family beta-propeller protein